MNTFPWHLIAQLQSDRLQELVMQGGTVLFWSVLAFGFLVGVTLVIKHLLNICPPNEVLIFSGRRRRMEDGSIRGYTAVFGGGRLRRPLIESVSRMSLNTMEVPISIRGAYSKGGIPLNVDAIANVKISSDPVLIGNAIERFLGRDPEEIRRVAKETLEGHLRGVLATLTPEEVNEDRLKFAAELSKESEEDLVKLGIQLDTLKIQHVSDDVDYLDSIGRKAVAKVIRDAEIAESNAKRAAEQAEAENMGRANVTRANAEASIARLQNDLRRIQADLEAKVQSEEERTTAAAREARATAEQELQRIRAELETIRLQADTVLPAEANKVSQELLARGEAASIREQGTAMAEAFNRLHEAWREAGSNALSVYLIEDIDKLLKRAADGIARVQVENLNVIDSGEGKTLSAYVAAYPAMMETVFDAVKRTTGIDIAGEISGSNHTPEKEDQS